MRKTLFTASALALTLGLSGCLVPEKFDASVNVKPDGSYTYKYDGSAVHYAAAAAIKEKGKLPEKDEVGLKRCPDSCDHIPRRSWALFQAREIMRSVLESFKREPST